MSRNSANSVIRRQNSPRFVFPIINLAPKFLIFVINFCFFFFSLNRKVGKNVEKKFEEKENFA